jgi:hypothetical protein
MRKRVVKIVMNTWHFSSKHIPVKSWESLVVNESFECVGVECELKRFPAEFLNGKSPMSFVGKTHPLYVNVFER